MREKAFQFPSRMTDGFVLLAVSLFILYPGSGGYQQLQQAKFGSFLLLFGGYLGLMALFALELSLLNRRRPPSPAALWRKAGPARRAVAMFLLVTAVSTLTSPLRRQALLGMSRGEGLLTLAIYCGVFFCVSAFARPKGWWSLVLGGAMTAFDVICLMQLRGLNPLGLYPEGYTYFDANVKYGGVYLGTTGNADLTAALLCLTIPLFWILLLRWRDRRRWWLTVPLALSLTVLVEMDVQAGLVALVLGTVLTVPAVLIVPAGKRRWLWAAAAALLAVGLAGAYFSHRTWGTVYELHELLHGNWDPEFGSGRIYIWQQVLHLVPEHLLLGTGPDTMAAAGIPGFVRQSAATGEPLRYFVDVAHNEYLNILYHQGLLALLPYLGGLLCSAVHWLRQSGKNPAAAALGGGVLCYGIQAMFGFSMCQTAGLFWIAWGLLERVCGKTEE